MGEQVEGQSRYKGVSGGGEQGRAPEWAFTQKPRDYTAGRAFFIVTAVKTSNLTQTECV
jgi:hypothetical protein